MDVFTQIDDGLAIVRMPKGIYKQVELFARGDQAFIKHAGGFVRLCSRFGNEFSTSHPQVKVIEFEGRGIEVQSNGAVRFEQPKLRAA